MENKPSDPHTNAEQNVRKPNQPEKPPGYGDKKLNGPNRPSD